MQRAEVAVEAAGARAEVVIQYEPKARMPTCAPKRPPPGARSEGLRILRSRAEKGALHLRLEGLASRTYALRVRSPRRLEGVAGATVRSLAGRDFEVAVAFEGPLGAYVRRDLALPLR